MHRDYLIASCPRSVREGCLLLCPKPDYEDSIRRPTSFENSIVRDGSESIVVCCEASLGHGSYTRYRCLLKEKQSSGEEDPWEDKLSVYQFWGRIGVSAAGWQGKGLRKRNVIFVCLSYIVIIDLLFVIFVPTCKRSV